MPSSLNRSVGNRAVIANGSPHVTGARATPRACPCPNDNLVCATPHNRYETDGPASFGKIRVQKTQRWTDQTEVEKHPGERLLSERKDGFVTNRKARSS